MSLYHLLFTPEAADYLGLSPGFLNKLQCTGDGSCCAELDRRVVDPKAKHSRIDASRCRSVIRGRASER